MSIEHYKTSDGKGEVAHMKTTSVNWGIAARATGKILRLTAAVLSGGGKLNWSKIWDLARRIMDETK